MRRLFSTRFYSNNLESSCVCGVFRPLVDRRMHVLTDADDNVNDKSDMSIALN